MDEEINDLQEIADLFKELVNDVPHDLKDKLNDKISDFNKNLNTVEACLNKTIATLPWIEFNDLITVMSDDVWKIWEVVSDDFKKHHFYQLYKLDRIINFIGIDKSEPKLLQLSKYYDKLTEDHKKEVHELEVKTKLLQTVVVDFFNYSNEVAVVNENNLNDANIRKEAILSTLSSQIWLNLSDQIFIYDEEGFLVDEFDDSQKKTN